MKRYGLFLFLSFSFINASAVEVEGLGVLGIDFGGDTLVDVTYADGSKADIDAGRGLILGGGANWTISPNAFIQTTIAWKFTTVPQASNGDITWTRIPVEIIGYYKQDKVRVGAGISYHMSNKLKGTGFASSLTTDFENTLGYVVGLEYMITPRMSLTGRYTIIDYTPTKSTVSINGNSVGFGINWYFGNK